MYCHSLITENEFFAMDIFQGILQYRMTNDADAEDWIHK